MVKRTRTVEPWRRSLRERETTREDGEKPGRALATWHAGGVTNSLNKTHRRTPTALFTRGRQEEQAAATVQHPTMTTTTAVALLLGTLLCLLAQPVLGAALTTELAPQERSCYYAWVDKVGEKVGFYFAVQSGGSFDIDYDITAPSDKVIIEGKKERQLDIIFTGNEVGEYSFCFENDMSSYTEKVVSSLLPAGWESRVQAD